MNYDEFESTMLEAGWNLEEIENMWLNHQDYEYANDTWDN